MQNRGFTVTEFMVALGVGALAIGVCGKALEGVRAQTRLDICRGNIRDLLEAGADQNLAAEDSWQGRLRLDVDRIGALESRGCDRNTLLCPANERLTVNAKLQWEFAARPAIKRAATIPLGYFWIPGEGPRESDSPRNRRIVGQALVSSNENGSAPSRYARIVDYVVSDANEVFANVTRQAWVRVNDTTNHLDAASKPLGGNIGFADGHVAWRPFSQMQKQWCLSTANDPNGGPFANHDSPVYLWW